MPQRERFKSCSGGQLEYDKAIGSGVYNGVVEVTINQNINNMHYKDASNLASATGVFSDVKRDHIMYILPDNADFTGSFIAWGVFDGYTTWFKSRVASFPFVQVRKKMTLNDIKKVLMLTMICHDSIES
jgi:hypothetical protein